jgi:hypothetical protein
MGRKPVNSEKAMIYAFLTLILILSAASYAHAEPVSHPANSMWVEPPSITLTPQNATLGYKFNVTVWLNISDVKVFSYSIGLLYNRTQLKATRGGFTKDFTAGHDTQTAGPIIDTSYLGNGSILATESCKGEDYIPGPKVGTLIWIEFQVIATPPEGQTLTSQLDITKCYPDDTWVMDYNLNSIELNGFNASYTFIPEFSTLSMILVTMLLSSILVIMLRMKKHKS